MLKIPLCCWPTTRTWVALHWRTKEPGDAVVPHGIGWSAAPAALLPLAPPTRPQPCWCWPCSLKSINSSKSSSITLVCINALLPFAANEKIERIDAPLHKLSPENMTNSQNSTPKVRNPLKPSSCPQSSKKLGFSLEGRHQHLTRSREELELVKDGLDRRFYALLAPTGGMNIYTKHHFVPP